MGSGLAPFAVQPAAARTIPRTVPSFGVLPYPLPDAEIGQMAWVTDQAYMAIYRGLAVGWEALGTDWRAWYPGDLALTAAAGVWQSAGATTTLTQGWWHVSVKMLLYGIMDAPDPCGAGCQSISELSIHFQLWNFSEGWQFDDTYEDVSSRTIQTADDTWFPMDAVVSTTVMLQGERHIPTGFTDTVGVRVRRNITPPMDLRVGAFDCVATRLSDFNNS